MSELGPAMNVFRELIVTAPDAQVKAFADALGLAPLDGWKRDAIAESQARAFPLSDVAFCFSCSQSEFRQSAMLFLTRKTPGRYVVTNIVPVERFQLTRSEYNGILENFIENVARPLANKFGLEIEMTSSQAGLETWLSRDAAEKLRQFSQSANKGTGASHPLDRKRWNAFVLSANDEKNRLDASTLMRWLIEVEGWSRDVAEQLATEYEYGLELLAARGGV